MYKSSLCRRVQLVEPLGVLAERLPDVVFARHAAQDVSIRPAQRRCEIYSPAETLAHCHIEVFFDDLDRVALERINGRVVAVVLVVDLAEQVWEELLPEGGELLDERAKVVLVFPQVALVRCDVELRRRVLRRPQVVVSGGG